MLSLKVKQYSTLIGSLLLHFMIGSVNTFANLNTYITSYLRKNGSKDANYGESVWFIAVGVSTFTLTTIISGFIANKIGARISGLIGTIVLCGSIGLTSLSVKNSFIAVLMTLGFMQNVGSGLMNTVIIVNCIKWFPTNKGLVTGLIIGSSAVSSLIFTQIQTFYVNPNNLKPDSDGYFNEDDLLLHLPSLFIVLSVIYGSIGLIAVCLIFNYTETNTIHLNVISYDTNESQSNILINDYNENIINRSIEINKNFSLRQAMKTKRFYILLITFALGTQSCYIFGTMIKAFGESFIYDDHYLAIILSLGFIVNGIGGVFWGKILDILKFKDTITCLNGILAISMFTLIISSYYYMKILFTIWAYILYFTTVGIFACYLPEVVLRFGDERATTIYGFILTGPAIACLITSPIIEWMLNMFGWFIAFSIVGGLNTISMIIIMAFYQRQHY